MVSYLNELLLRVVAIQKEAMLTGFDLKVDAWPQFFKAGESFPYFTNRIADLPVTDDGSQDEDVNTPLVIMRLVVAHLTSGYHGEPEHKLYEWMIKSRGVIGYNLISIILKFHHRATAYTPLTLRIRFSFILITLQLAPQNKRVHVG